MQISDGTGIAIPFEVTFRSVQRKRSPWRYYVQTYPRAFVGRWRIKDMSISICDLIKTVYITLCGIYIELEVSGFVSFIISMGSTLHDRPDIFDDYHASDFCSVALLLMQLESEYKRLRCHHSDMHFTQDTFKLN